MLLLYITNDYYYYHYIFWKARVDPIRQGYPSSCCRRCSKVGSRSCPAVSGEQSRTNGELKPRKKQKTELFCCCATWLWLGKNRNWYDLVWLGITWLCFLRPFRCPMGAQGNLWSSPWRIQQDFPPATPDSVGAMLWNYSGRWLFPCPLDSLG